MSVNNSVEFTAVRGSTSGGNGGHYIMVDVGFVVLDVFRVVGLARWICGASKCEASLYCNNGYFDATPRRTIRRAGSASRFSMIATLIASMKLPERF